MAGPKRRIGKINEDVLLDTKALIHFYSGAQVFHMEIFGSELAKREGYSQHDGLDAIRFYLMKKYGWLPRDVKAMSADDLQFAMAEEMNGWTLPVEARQSYPKANRD